MKALIEPDGTMVLRLSPVDDALAYAQFQKHLREHMPLRYAYNPNEPRDEDGKWTKGPKVKIDPKKVEARPYHSMTSFPGFADTEAKRKLLEQLAPKQLQAWREAATARVSMGPSERLEHRKVLDQAFKELKAALGEPKKWNAVEPVAAAKKKVRALKPSAEAVKSVRASVTKGGRQTADQLAGDTAIKIKEVEEQWVEMAQTEAERVRKNGYHGKHGGGRDMPDMEGQLRELMGKASPHKLAKALGLNERYKNVEAARTAIVQRVVQRVGSILRSVI